MNTDLNLPLFFSYYLIKWSLTHTVATLPFYKPIAVMNAMREGAFPQG